MRKSCLITALVSGPLQRPARLLSLGLALVLLTALSTGCYVFRDFDPPPEQMDASVDADPNSPGTDEDRDGDGSARPDASSRDTGNDPETDCVAVGAPNEAQFFCGRTRSTCGNITVVDDCGVAHNVQCGTCQDGAACLGDSTTFPRECACDCEIGGKCVAAGSVKNDNACLVCDPSQSRNEWSPEVDKSCGGTPSCSCNQRGRCIKANGSDC